MAVAGMLAQQALRQGEGGGAAHDVAERLEAQLETAALFVVRVDEQHVHVGRHERQTVIREADLQPETPPERRDLRGTCRSRADEMSFRAAAPRRRPGTPACLL